MTQRSSFYQLKIEMKVRLQAIMARWLFLNEETFMTRLVKKLFRFDRVPSNNDPDLKHPDL